MEFENLSQQLETHLGQDLSDQIMEGSEKAAKADRLRRARWIKCCMERMDALVDEPTRIRIMEQRGHSCGWQRSPK